MIVATMPARLPAAPPLGADAHRLLRLSPVGATVDVEALAKAAGLPLVRPADEVAALLSDAAERWLLDAAATPLSGAAPGAPPSDRAAFCDSVADAAEALLLRLGASPGRFAVTSRAGMGGGAGDRAELDPASELHEGVANLHPLSRLTPSQRAELWTPEADIELLLAPLLASEPMRAKCGLQGAVAITPDVIAHAVAGVELLKRLGRLSADAWRIIGKENKPGGARKASARLTKPGGARKASARLTMTREIARIYEHAFGCGWQEAGTGRQAPRTHRFVRFVDTFARIVAAAADPATLSACGAQGPAFRAGTAKELAKKLQREPAPSRKSLPDFPPMNPHRGRRNRRSK